MQWKRNNASVAPVTQNIGSKKGTAMVFMNMGGPSTTDEVGSFLSRLFVGVVSVIVKAKANIRRLMLISFHLVAYRITLGL